MESVGYYATYPLRLAGRALIDGGLEALDEVLSAPPTNDSGKVMNAHVVHWVNNLDVNQVGKILIEKLDALRPYLEEHAMGWIESGGKLFAQSLLTFLPQALLAYGAWKGVEYSYKMAEHRMTRPKLATEIKQVGWKAQVYENATSAAVTLFNIAAPGMLLATGIKAAATALPPIFKASVFLSPMIRYLTPEIIQKMGSHVSEFGSQWIPSGLDQASNGFQGFSDEVMCKLKSGSVSEVLFPNLKSLVDQGPEVYSNSNGVCPNSSYLQKMDRFAIGIGLMLSCYIAGSFIYHAYHQVKEAPAAKAVFNRELTGKIKTITHATYNLRKNNGYFQNLLLYGPGGTGKTMVAKLIAKNAGLNYIVMSGGDLAQYIKRGEHVTELNKLILQAKSNPVPTILFIDEAESLAMDRELMTSPEKIELLNAFLNHTGEHSKKLMIILATNRLEDLDEAVLTRMDHKLYVGPPAVEERKRILEQYVPTFFSPEERKEFFTRETIALIAKKTEGFTGRILFKMLNAIAGYKNASSDNKLTHAMIDLVVDNFINQEQMAKELRAKKKGFPATGEGPARVAETVKPSFFKKLYGTQRGDEKGFKAEVGPVRKAQVTESVPSSGSRKAGISKSYFSRLLKPSGLLV